MKKIPAFLFEEHHEAFFVWNYSIINNLIRPNNNILLHVDEHSDMAVPNFSYSIKSIRDSLPNLYDFTYKELTIANFIVPTIYQGMFSQVYWLYQSNNEGKAFKKPIVVYSHNSEGKVLKIDVNSDLESLAFFNPDFKKFLFKSVKVQDELPEIKSVVLDIDLDYFSCNPFYYYYRGKLEITKEQYDAFNRDKYHFLRFFLGSGVKSEMDEKRYYLFFNYSPNEVIPSKLKVSKEEIVKRIELFINFLIKNNVQPKLINICRSRLSGFTPKDQWEFIEENLIKNLNALYELNVYQLREIFKQEHLKILDK